MKFVRLPRMIFEDLCAPLLLVPVAMFHILVLQHKPLSTLIERPQLILNEIFFVIPMILALQFVTFFFREYLSASVAIVFGGWFVFSFYTAVDLRDPVQLFFSLYLAATGFFWFSWARIRFMKSTFNVDFPWYSKKARAIPHLLVEWECEGVKYSCEVNALNNEGITLTPTKKLKSLGAVSKCGNNFVLFTEGGHSLKYPLVLKAYSNRGPTFYFKFKEIGLDAWIELGQLIARLKSLGYFYSS